MPPVTPEPPPLAAFDALLDRERSRAFHRGELAFTLDTMRALLAALPPVPRPRVSVQIVGSEGKTSTAWLVSAALLAHGLRTGTYTSPHLHDPRERLRVDLELPRHAELVGPVAEVRAAATGLPAPPSWFEALTATARQLFAARGVQAAVWEAGLGGRLDATTLLPADLLILSSVSLEHTAILGGTLEAVAGEKLAAVRPGGALLLASDLPPSVAALAREVAEQRGARLFDAPPPDRRESCFRARALARGAADALRALDLLPAATDAERAALAEACPPGRDLALPDLYVDAAHSAAACADLAARLDPATLGWLVFGATAGRDAAALLAPLLPVVEGVVLTRVPGGRAQEPAELAAALPPGTPHALVDDPAAALAEARARSTTGRRILVTGSLYLLGALLPPGSSTP